MTFTGYIYKITGACGKVYIGSTVDYYKRRQFHNTSSNSTSSRKLKKPLQFEVIRKDDYKLMKTMLLVEQYYIDIHKCVNKKRAYTNPFIRKLINKIYYEKNKDLISKNAKEKYQKNKESRKEKTREAYHKNKEYNREKAKENYYKNKEKLKFNCPYCNVIIQKNNLKKHQKTKRCLAVQATKQININITINL